MPPTRRSAIRGLTLRGKTWWMRETLPRYGRVQISLNTRDLSAALKEAEAIRRDPTRVVVAPALQTDLVAAYSAHQVAKGLSRQWRDSCSSVLRKGLKEMKQPARTLTAAALQKWLDATRRRSANTAQTYQRIFSGFCKWMLERRHRSDNPMGSVTVPRTPPHIRRSFLSHDEARRLLDTCHDPELKFCLYCALHAGMRKGEIVAARPQWFDVGARLIHISNSADWTVKDRDNRTVPLTDEFREFLAGFGLRSPYMLMPEVEPGISRYRFDFQKRWLAHRRACGLERFTFHDLRRTFASLLASAGVSIFKISVWLGDGVAVVEKRYAHLRQNDDEINAAWKPKPKPK